jgi:hypothetical protein
MSQSELLIHTVKALEKSAHEYMLTGSLVSSLQGEPRATHDIDFIVAATSESIEEFLKEFPDSDYYYDVNVARESIKNGGMFNVLAVTGDRIDIWALTNSEFDQSRLSRRLKIELFGLTLNVTSPEDTIIMKLLWAKQCGGSEKQLFDASRVYDLQRGSLDTKYFEKWIRKLKLEKQYVAMKRYL